MAEARKLNHNYVGTEDLLPGCRSRRRIAGDMPGQPGASLDGAAGCPAAGCAGATL